VQGKYEWNFIALLSFGIYLIISVMSSTVVSIVRPINIERNFKAMFEACNGVKQKG